MQDDKFYVGMWVTKDGNIRHELLANGRYDEARGNRKSAYQGSYKMTGNHIDYKDLQALKQMVILGKEYYTMGAWYCIEKRLSK